MKRVSIFRPNAYTRQEGTIVSGPFYAFRTWYVAIVLDNHLGDEPIVEKLCDVEVTQA